MKIAVWVRFVSFFIVTAMMLNGVLPTSVLAKSDSIVHQSTPGYNTAFLTDAQLEDYTSMNTTQIRAFLTSKNSYFRGSIKDVDGVTVDFPTVIYQAANTYKISPKVLLATMQKETGNVTRSTRPSDTNMKSLMGCGAASPTSTARNQMSCAAKAFRSYQDSLNSTGQTVSGWRVNIAKNSSDGIAVTPATKAVAGQFTYTPWVGAGWGGQNGGVALFSSLWNSYSFGATKGGMDLYGYCLSKGYANVSLIGQTVYDWKCKTSSGQYVSINLSDECLWQYKGVLNVPKFTDVNNPYSWACYVH